MAYRDHLITTMDQLESLYGEKLPTSGLVVIDLPFDDWSRVHPSAGRLERFVSPRLIEEATD